MLVEAAGVTTAGAAMAHLGLALALVRLSSPLSPPSRPAPSWSTTAQPRPTTPFQATSLGQTPPSWSTVTGFISRGCEP